MLHKTFQFSLDLLDLHLIDEASFPYLLDSAAHGHVWNLGANQEFVELRNTLGRYSILFAFPQSKLVLNANYELSYEGEKINGQFLETLDQLFQGSGIEQPQSELPFLGGWFLYLGYELAREVEPVLDLPVADIPEQAIPVAIASRIPAAVIVDHQEAVTHVVSEPGFNSKFSSLCELVASHPKSNGSGGWSDLEVSNLLEEEPQIYIEAIKKTHDYIHDGDIFQANLSREWNAVVNASAGDVYRRLRRANPGPFSGVAVFANEQTTEKHAVISSSPERLLRIQDGRADTRPIAGTRARGANDDELVRQELIKHPKERAEHVMLIDLERNDIGRICEYGSVHVDELMVIETYEHVHHIVSNVTGKLRASVTPGQAIKAVFPGGTITGCPKVRCMEIIAELEGKPREAYTGSMGYLNHNGNMDLNILIRTIQMHTRPEGNYLSFRAGGGIVYDSDAEREVEETRAKARGLIQALQE